jgi:peptide/nickel transport system substrate-binding protein
MINQETGAELSSWLSRSSCKNMLSEPRKRATGIVTALTAFAALAAPCFAEETPRPGGTAIAVLGADPVVLNPDISVGVPDIFAGCAIYDALVRFGEGFKIVPGLAKSWEIAPDGLSYTFHLETASFSDGKPITSDDVKFTLLEVSSKFGAKFSTPGKAIKDIETPDPSTVVIHLSRPFGPFLFSLACEQNAGILPAHVFRGTDVMKNPASTTTPVGSGPFTVGEWVRGDHLTLVKNPNYWRKGQPYLDRLVIKTMPDSSARILALQAGEIDFIDEYYFPLSSYKLFAADPRFEVRDVSYPSDDLMMFNTRNAPYDKKEVRQALLIALDRNYIHKNVFYDTGSVAHGPIDTRIPWAYNPAVDYEKMYAYDPARAAKLLDDVGLKPGADGVRFQLRLIFDAGRPEYTPWAQAVQRYWQAIGVKVVLEGAERPIVLKRVFSDYDFDVALQNYTTSGDPALGISRIYATESIKQGTTFNNASGYSNPEVDDLFAKGRDAPTEAERAKLYFKVQEILARDLPTLTIHQQAEIDVASAKLRGMWHGANYMWWDDAWLQQ